MYEPRCWSFYGAAKAAKEESIASFEFCFGFEAEEPRKHRLQELMWEEMRRFHPEQGPWKGEKDSPAKAASGSNARWSAPLFLIMTSSHSQPSTSILLSCSKLCYASDAEIDPWRARGCLLVLLTTPSCFFFFFVASIDLFCQKNVDRSLSPMVSDRTLLLPITVDRPLLPMTANLFP